MPRGRRTSYARDNNGRFASSPGGGTPKRSTPATRRAAMRAGNRLNRDNAGRISGIGRDGATVRGGRLKTAKGNRRATQLASMKAAGFRSGTIAKGGRGIRGSVARSLAAARKERMAAARSAAAKQQLQRPSKKPASNAQRAYLAARSNARSRNSDLRGADAGSRRMANSAAAVLRNMERRRSAAVPKAPADSPRAKQQQRQLERSQRAGRNEQAAWAREADGPGSKASRSASVARRAQQIYAGKVDPKAKTKSRLTKTRDPEVLRKRIARIKDNTARAAAKAAAKAAKASAKPAKKESKRNISDAKAGRIIARLDANRPGLRKATGSDRRHRNLMQTYDRASKFVLAASTRESKRSGGQSRMDLAESVRRAVRNAKAKAKPKAAKATIGRVPTKGPGRGPLMKAKATPAKPSPKSPRIRTSIESASRPAGTVAKPRGMKPGVLAARRGVKAKPVRLPKSAAQAVTQANRLLDKLKMQKMKNPGGAGSYQIRDRIDQVNQAIKKIVPGYRHNPTRKGGAAKAAFAEQNRRYGRDARARNNIGRLYG